MFSRRDPLVNGSYYDIFDLLDRDEPKNPVYCIYPHVYARSTRRFVDGFPGRTLYAVKANPHPEVLREIRRAGVRDFDCASLAEVARVTDTLDDVTCYYMNPVRLPGHAKEAQQRHRVRHFVIDDASGLAMLATEVDCKASVIFARMAVSHSSAMMNLSAKFGAPPGELPELLSAVRATGAEPALAFNVGSGVTDPEAYALALGIVRRLLAQLPFRIRLLDIGGGFPLSYPDYPVPELDEFFDRVRQSATDLELAESGELIAEPGRALAGPGLSVVTRVLLRKPDRIYLNDGMYGGFWELRFGAQKRYPARTLRNGRELGGNVIPLRVFGPTCDASDELPAPVPLPADIRAGDHVEFGGIGAYSLSGRTDFNGFGSYRVVRFEGTTAAPG